jgi:hypothetical protein
MSYTGRAPSQAPITSADINDGAVAPADLSTGAPSWDTSGNVTVGGNVALGDNDKAIFGAGSDLQIYHDGSHSYIKDAGTGQLRLLAGTNVQIWNADASKLSANFNAEGTAYLFYNGNTKFETTPTGIDVTGTVTADGLTVDAASVVAVRNAGTAELKIHGNVNSSAAVPTLSFIRGTGDVAFADAYTDHQLQSAGGTLYLKSGESSTSRTNATFAYNGDISFYEDTGTTPKFFWDASAETLSISTSPNGNNLLLKDGSDNEITHNFFVDTNGNGAAYLYGEGQSAKIYLNTAGSSYFNGGNVGIGTSSPASKLDVRDSISASTSLDPTLLTLRNDSDGGAAIDFKNDVNGNSRIASKVNSTGGGTNETSLVFSTSNSGVLAEAMRIDSSGNVGIGTSSPNSSYNLTLAGATAANGLTVYNTSDSNRGGSIRAIGSSANGVFDISTTSSVYSLTFGIDSIERMRIDSSGTVLVGKTTTSIATAGFVVNSTGQTYTTCSNDTPSRLNRLTSDGTLIVFYQDNTSEGSISVSGSTVSYNGGHLARWSQLADGTKDESLVKGTVLTNLDQMAVWHHEAVEAQDAVYDEEGNVVTEAVEAKEAYTEDNEQLNCMAVSSVEGDPNVAGVFVNWDNDDDGFNDMNIAMTGDMVIRIAQGTTVARGDLLMSAGDGTAKPQGDDIVRSKTIAKVTSTNVSHTYDDGSYLVPCVLMAC